MSTMSSGRNVFPPEVANDIDELLNSIQELEQTLQSVGGDQLRVDIANNDAGFDADIISEDIGGGGQFALTDQKISGTQRVIIKVESAQDNEFTVSVEWTDGSGTTLFTQEPPEAKQTPSVDLKYVTSSDHVTITIGDESGESTNEITGTIHSI